MAVFGEMPEILHCDEVEPMPFYYNHKDTSFTIGNSVITLASYELARHMLSPVFETVSADEISSHPVLLSSLGKPFATPKFYTWLGTEEFARALSPTINVMQQVYENLAGRKLTKTEKRDTKSHHGFIAGLERTGHIHLQVFGNCACLGTDPMGTVVDSSEWETGYVEYDFHNIDSDAQKVSLLAGLGHLATECSEH